MEEVEGDPNRPLREDDDEGLDLSARCWWDEGDECWMTDFPPPPGFTGDESRPYDEPDDDEPYERACTAEEAAILDTDRAADHAAQRAEDETLRDGWFALLRAECSEADAERRPSSTKSRAEPASLPRSGQDWSRRRP